MESSYYENQWVTQFGAIFPQEFARLLQEQEGSQQLDMLDQDRLMAIEAQDKELARMLQERVSSFAV
jgi:hypothetical protein